MTSVSTALELQQLAPVSVHLAQHLQTLYSCDFQRAWSFVMNMVPDNPSHSFEHCLQQVNGCVEDIRFGESYLASQYSISAAIDATQRPIPVNDCRNEHVQPAQQLAPSKFSVLAWNVRGLRSSMPAVHHLLSIHEPLALVLCETHLSAKQHSTAWLRGVQTHYEIHASSFPDVNPLASGQSSSQGRIQLQSRNRAGVLIAVRKNAWDSQYVRTHATPSQLKGFLHHVSIHSPATRSLHILGIYVPPMSSPDWREIQSTVFQYIDGLRSHLLDNDARLLIAGDMNAVTHPLHRSHGRMLPIDNAFIAHTIQCQLTSCFTAEASSLPHTCRSQRSLRSFASSRIDHILTMDQASQSPPMTSDLQHHVLFGSMYECSDHQPLLLELSSQSLLRTIPLRCLPSLGPLPAQGQTPSITCKPVILSFSKAALQEWQSKFSSANALAISHASTLVEAALMNPQPSQHAFDAIVENMMSLIDSAVAIAGRCFPVQAAPPAQLPHTPRRGLPSYLPRVVAKRYQHHVAIAKACRTVATLAAADQSHHVPYGEFIIQPHVAVHLCICPHLLLLIQQVPSYDRMFDLVQQRRHDAQGAVNAILKDHRAKLRTKQRQKWQQLWYKRRKSAYAQVFRARHDPRGAVSSPSQAIPAVHHPLYGPTAHPQLALQALHFHHAQVASPAVTASDLSFPWEQPGTDSYDLQKRGDGLPLCELLTIEVYQLCLRGLKNGKAPGPDRVPNELLKHFPAAMHRLLWKFFRLCWQQGQTPHAWKESITLLFYKKGDPCDPSNYRPIALLDTVYKLWTKIIAHLISTYCERFGILSEPQEGFRKFKNCPRQLQYLKLALEDAKLHNHDLCLCLLDLKSAFNSVDHPRLIKIMQALGIPEDAVAVVKDLHIGARTSIRTNFGTTAPIQLRRGTIQGDSLSPLLFILFIEPLLRWLQVNDRGYRCVSSSRTSAPLYANVLAAADDIALLASTTPQLQVQLDKVQSFTSWSGMLVAPAKCIASAVLWGANSRGTAPSPTDWSIIEPMLLQLRIQGSALHCLPPDQPFRYLGPLLTLTMDWKPHLHMLLDLISSKGLAIATSHGTIQQKLDMEYQCIVSAIAYHLHIAPFSLAQLRQLDAARARVLKSILRVSNAAASEMLFLPRSELGCGVQSLAPIYAQICADAMASSLNDMGRLGAFAKAVLLAHLQAWPQNSLQEPRASWVSRNHHMHLRQAAVLLSFQFHPRFNAVLLPQHAILDLYELITTMVAVKSINAPLHLLQAHVLVPLWRAFGYTCSPFMQGQALLSMHDITVVHPHQMADSTVKSAYKMFLQICCSPHCNFMDMLASPADAIHAPHSHHLLTPLASTQTMPAVPHLDLESLIELDHILHFAPPSLQPSTEFCYSVAWCPTPFCSPTLLRRLARSGITPAPAGVVPPWTSWAPSILPRTTIAALWPGKLAAFEAKLLRAVVQLHLHHSNNVDAKAQLQYAQARSQHLFTANSIPAYHAPVQQVCIQFEDVNPDRDVHTTGSCLLAMRSSQQVAVYSACGAWKADLLLTEVEALAHIASPQIWHSANFSTAVHGLLQTHCHNIRTQQRLAVFMDHFSLPAVLVRAFQATFTTEVEWFASSLNRQPCIPCYASLCEGDRAFSSLGEAYSFRWTGSGYVNTGLNTEPAIKALRWAIASCRRRNYYFASGFQPHCHPQAHTLVSIAGLPPTCLCSPSVVATTGVMHISTSFCATCLLHCRWPFATASY